MAKKKNAAYVVWKGHKTGVFDTWAQCQQATSGYAGAQFKGFTSKAEALAAFNGELSTPKAPTGHALTVDAAWNSVGKDMEYQGVWLDTGETAFRVGPIADGTNNIGEFLAIVHGLALLKQLGDDCPIYTDSATAMAWLRKKKANSQNVKEGRVDAKLIELLARAELWLQENPYPNKVLKWHTKDWGEIPADFGRK
ncbi:ribonuclease H1 domain-containing protein [Salinibius halmophilus]|uniref:ribonuclease H1 domain-containing protein n=1 Tax=Salinibius halmophilus TaxID=1853216 RepID=UPI000E65EC34|nr:ribonuclease H family protein [Salinibius halmophilus]